MAHGRENYGFGPDATRQLHGLAPASRAWSREPMPQGGGNFDREATRARARMDYLSDEESVIAQEPRPWWSRLPVIVGAAAVVGVIVGGGLTYQLASTSTHAPAPQAPVRHGPGAVPPNTAPLPNTAPDIDHPGAGVPWQPEEQAPVIDNAPQQAIDPQGPPDHVPPAQNAPGQVPPAQPPAQAPPSQGAPGQAPPAQAPPAQAPPAQAPPGQAPPAQAPPAQAPPAQAPPAQAQPPEPPPVPHPQPLHPPPGL